MRDIPRHFVRAGDLGGLVESERNLSQEGDAWVSGKALVYGDAKVCREADISETRDALTVGPIGSRDDDTTFFKEKGGVGVSCGCFRGTLEEFAAAVEETHKDSPRHLAEYRAAIALARARWGDGR